MHFKRIGLAAVALLATAGVAALGQVVNNAPVVGGAAGCAGYSTGPTGQVCTSTIPAGPAALTGAETIPAATNLASGAQPQVVNIPAPLLNAGQGAERNMLRGADFDTNLWQRGTTFTALTPTTAAMTADGWFIYSSANTVTVTKQTTGSLANQIRASLRVNRPSGSNTTEICVGQVLPAKATARLLGRNAVFSFYGLAGSALSSSGSSVNVTIAYGTAADSATPGTNTDAWAKATLTGYAAVTAGASSGTTATTTSNVSNIALSTTWTRYSVYGAIPTTATTVGVKVCYTPVGTGGANDNFEIANAQLEPHVTSVTAPTAFARRNQADDTALQLLYSYVLTDGAATVRYGLGQATTTTNANFVVPFPQQMRITPTTTVGTAASWQATVAAGTAQACTTLAAIASSNTLQSAGLSCTVAANLAAGNATQMIGQATGGLLTFSAEP